MHRDDDLVGLGLLDRILERRRRASLNAITFIEVLLSSSALSSNRLSDDQLARLLGSIDVTKAIGLRTRAMVECLVSLGLRAKEVAALRLDDVDWRAGTLGVNTSKVRRADVLPLPQTVGRAVAAYLKRGRPMTTDKHVFVLHYMPVGAPLDSADVTQTVRRAFAHAGLSLPSTGAHVLRHTTASRLVRAGAASSTSRI